MFEKRKLRKYADYIIGFAYEYIGCDINTYLVIKKEKIDFIKYKNYDLNTATIAAMMVDCLIKQGYKDLNYWVKNNQESKKLVKSMENSISYTSERPSKK